jgi:hypothetical protein
LSTRARQAAGAADYPLAREAAAASKPATSIHHLELATRQSPVYASVALHDPAFQAMRGPVEEFASRVSFMAGIDQTAGRYQPPRGAPQTGTPTGDSLHPAQIPLVTELLRLVKPPKQPAILLDESGTAPRLPSSTQPDTPGPEFAASTPPSKPISRLAAPPFQPPTAGPLLPFLRAVAAEIDFALLQPWNTEPAQTVAANEYQLARAAVQAGDHPAALQHVEQAILAHPAQATAALADPAFYSIKVPVHDLVTRLIFAARE